MWTLFAVCALIGCTLLLLQTAMQLIGMGHDAVGEFAPDADVGGPGHAHDASAGHDHAHGSTPLPKIIQFLSYQTVVSFLAFFGLGGLAALQADVEPAMAGVLAFLAGSLSAVVITYVLKGFRKLQRDGAVRIHRALGCTGRVYLRIPAEGSGVGKVTIEIQGRTIEVRAKTSGPMLATGTRVVVHAVLDEQTVEVAPLEQQTPVAVA